MTMQRADLAGLRDERDWYEIGFATGDADFPLARLRLVPLTPPVARAMVPNAPVAPGRVIVRASASLVDAEGAVLTIGGGLLIGGESVHQWQFDADAPFDPESWVDGVAEMMVVPLLRQARGLASAASARLLVVAALDEPE